MQGVFNPNIPIFPPRVCTLVLFILKKFFGSKIRQSGGLLAPHSAVLFGRNCVGEGVPVPSRSKYIIDGRAEQASTPPVVRFRCV